MNNYTSNKVYNRYDRGQKYKNILLRPNPTQSAEINEIQSFILDEMGQLVKSLYGDGRIFSGGSCFFTPGFGEKTHIICNSASTLDNGDYFTIDAPNNNYYVWFTINGSGTDPNQIGRISVPVALLSGDNNSAVASKLASALDLQSDFEATVFSNKVILINSDIGVVSNPVTDGPTGHQTEFIITQVIPGSDKLARFEDTVFYANDVSNDVSTVDLPIGLTEDVKVGIAISTEFTTEIEDPGLLNPAMGTENEGTAGAAREKVLGRWVKEADIETNETFYPIHTFKNGELITPTKRGPEIENILSTIENYDIESNGSYVSKGFNITYQKDIDTDGDLVEDRHLMDLGDGLAHIDGVRIYYPYNRKFNLEFATDTAIESNELINFTVDGWYYLNLAPFANIGEVNGTKNIDQLVTRSTTGQVDNLSNTPVYSVNTVYQGATTYIVSTDYSVSGNTIVWVIGHGPDPGETYNVDYDYGYIDDIADPTDLDRVNNKIYIEGFKNPSSVFVDYTYYLSRYDRITMLKTGEINIIKGVSSYTNPVPPKLTVGLSLGTAKISKSSAPTINKTSNRAFLMKDIQNLQDTVRALQDSVAKLSQLENINSSDPTTNKLNSFTDPLTNDNFRDSGLVQTALILEGLLIPGYELTSTTLTLEDEFYFLDYSLETIIDQYRFSGSRQVNEFMWQDPPPLRVTITPNPYSWLAETVVNYVLKNIITGDELGETWHPGWRNPDSSWYKAISGSTTSSSEVTEIIQEMELPTITLDISASKLNSYEQVSIEFDSSPISGSFYADENGFLVSSFQTPIGAKSGNRLIEVTGLENNQTGSVTFIATPLLETVTEVTEMLVVRVLEDPVAEVFTIDQDRFIASVGVQITELPDEYLEVYILETQVGYPDRNKGIAVKRLYREDLSVSLDGDTISARTFVWNSFTFDLPIRLSAGVEYAIVVSCTDPNCKVRYITLGGYELTENKWQTTQALSNGVLLTSSTGSTWTAEHDNDLTFGLHAAVFNQNTLINGYYTKEIEFGEITVTNCTDIFISTAVNTYENTEVKYYATLLDINPVTVTEIVPLSYFEIETYSGRVSFKAVLKTSDTKSSPIISGSIAIAWGNIILPSDYITREFLLGIPSTHMNLSVDLYEPVANLNKFFFYTPTTTYFTFATTQQGSGSLPEYFTITCLAGSKLNGGEYFLFSSPSTNYYLWFTVNDNGLNPNEHSDIELSTRTAIQVDLLSDDTSTEVATRIKNAIDALAAFTATSLNSVVTVHNVNNGNVTDIIDGGGWREFIRTESTSLAYGYQELKLTTAIDTADALLDGLSSTRIKVILNSDNVLSRPAASNIRAYTYIP